MPNQFKGALIADLRDLSQLMPMPLPCKLPSLNESHPLYFLVAHLNSSYFFTQLDIFNMEWGANFSQSMLGKIGFE